MRFTLDVHITLCIPSTAREVLSLVACICNFFCNYGKRLQPSAIVLGAPH